MSHKAGEFFWTDDLSSHRKAGFQIVFNTLECGYDFLTSLHKQKQIVTTLLYVYNQLLTTS
jgi:hypothetical protein